MTRKPGTMTRRRLHQINVWAQLAVLAPMGALLVVIESGTWWEAVVLSAGVLAGLVAIARWPASGLSRVAIPCLIVSAAVWLYGVLVSGDMTAFCGIAIVGSITIPHLPRHRGIAAVGLTVFVAAAGATRLMVPQDDLARVLTSYVLVPAGVVVLSTGFMFINKLFYDLIAELQESRDREAELAVTRERMRFASDLHDIQGHTLHVVKLKSALAEKLVRTDAARAQEELREINALVGDTIAQTKALAYAQRRLNLSAELENAKNLFEAAGIRVHVEREAEVDAHAGELLGQVLRETTTNILRHAQAGQVRITLSKAGITIVNDGVHEAAPHRLSGLATLRDRMATNGGELTVQQKDGRFLTAAAFPHGRSAAAL
ncbi:histidine kinase [Nonomuraea sp. NPDC050404]|uniref:sensor histidine kinase n=1 Tax=Nonomuraea sp. NPDC050404 TaxID=3155783 RepID=UPI00340FDDFE